VLRLPPHVCYDGNVRTEFLNVDLDLEFAGDISELLRALGDTVINVLRDEPGKCTLELANQPASPEDAIRQFTALVERLPAPARADWDRCSLRSMNIGLQAGYEPYSAAFQLPFEVLAALGKLQAEVTFTVYRATQAESALKWLQGWYRAQCDGDWEHQSGLAIQSLDNPGWLLSVDLIGTDCEAAAVPQVVMVRGEPPSEENGNQGSGEWMLCEVKDVKFIGAGAAASLDPILNCFRKWAQAQREVRER
jgi:Immunity protein 53